jgi:hypothetical protein
MPTAAARRAAAARTDGTRVATRQRLRRRGFGWEHIAANVRADRWQLAGAAVVLHNAELNDDDRRQVALINCGPRALLTSFTVAAAFGLVGWEREQIHVLAPAGTRRPDLPDLVLHRTGQWDRVQRHPLRRLHSLAPALVLAASSFARPRAGCGLLAAAVQQRLIRPAALRDAVVAASRTRHRAQLIAALDDIAQGAQALSEIDFFRLCRKYRLPLPSRQAVRTEPDGRRRYLDAEWTLRSGRRVAVEVDGAVHLTPQRWYDDQLRQNEVVIGGTEVLRYPSVVVRVDEPLVASQLARILL